MSSRRTLAVRPLLRTACALLLLTAAPVPAQETATALRVDEAAVEVSDAAGTPVVDLTPGDLAVREAGEARSVLEVRPETRPWRVVVFLDAGLTATPSLARAARTLEGSARELTALGPVEVVLAGERTRTLLPPTRDPAALAAALARVSVFERGSDWLVELRREALAGLAEEARNVATETSAEAPRDGDVSAATSAGPGASLDPALMAAVLDAEADLVRERLDLLLGWLGDHPAGSAPEPAAGIETAAEGAAEPGPAVLLWVTDGFDLQPAAAWAGFAPAWVPGLTVPEAGPDLAPAVGTAARAAAALGWTVVPVRVPLEVAVDSRFGVAEGEDLATGDTTVLGTVRIPERRTPEQRAEAEARATAPPEPLAAAPDAPLLRFARDTGGRVVAAAAELPPALAALGARLRVRFASAAPPGEAVWPLEVAVAPAELTATARRWNAHATPPAVAGLRARRLLAGELDEGSAEVRAGVALAAVDEGAPRRAGTLEVRVEPPGDGPVSPAPRRLTVAVAGEDGAATVEQRTAAGEVGEDGAWVWRGALELPGDAERVAVVAEDPGTGAWGGAVAGIFDAAREAEGPWNAAAGILPGPKTVHLLRPDEGMLRGRVRFDAVADPRVARVDFLLDGRREAADAAAPYSAVLALGRLPLPRRIEAVAFDPGGTELGRDAMVVNQGGRAFRVRITEPSEPEAVGPVDVAAAVEVPDGRRLDRVEIYWNETLAATLFHPPFRHRLVVPPERPEGYLRAVAHLADGGTAEDAVYLNGPVPAERVDVRLTELFVVVTDSTGRPVRGLDEDDFEVREDGRRQELADFGDAADLPLTVGLAIDSSASMFVKLPAVAEAALGFLDGLTAGRDRAFLVDFDDEPRLLAGPTPDLGLLRGAGEALVPGGRTSLWKAVVYSLVQLQGAPGRRALVVYSDGADQDQDFSYRTALAFARRAGVPVYVIVANEEAVRTGGLDFGFPTFGSRLEGLVSATGGRVWLVRRTDDLASVYEAIQRELAAQYRLAYYPEAGDDGWRRIEVDVRGRGLTARTVSGYQR